MAKVSFSLPEYKIVWKNNLGLSNLLNESMFFPTSCNRCILLRRRIFLKGLIFPIPNGLKVVSQPVILRNPGKIWQIQFPKKLQIDLISINIPELIFISHCFALLHWGYAWVSKTRTSVSVAVMITGFMGLEACKAIPVSASCWL